MKIFLAIFLVSMTSMAAHAQDLSGIDVVIGVKGDARQLVDSVMRYNADPIGDISGATVAIVSRHPQVKNVIPVALGDKYKDFRIVGTTAEWLPLYKASLAEGRMWEHPFEAVAGSETGLKIGDKFDSVHSDGEKHKRTYKVTGLLSPSGGVADKLILTGVQSVYETHNVRDTSEKDGHEHSHSHDEKPHSHGADKIHHEVTGLLIDATSPYARINLPREINMTRNLQAVDPSQF